MGSAQGSGVRWHRRRIPPGLVLVSGRIGATVRRPVGLAPQVRGHVAPRVVDALERRGWHVHRIGAAAYVHSPAGDHLIFGVWPRRSPAPGWSTRLGRASAGYVRRLERVTRDQRWRRQLRDRVGRFGPLMPWTRWPTPALYSWEPVGPSVADQVDELEATSRRRWLESFPADAPELELRALDGDR